MRLDSVRVVAASAWRQWIRERQAVFWTMFFPLLFIVAFRLGFGGAVEGAQPIELIIVDEDAGVSFDLTTIPLANRSEVAAQLTAQGAFAEGNGTRGEDVLNGSHAGSLRWLLASLSWPDAPDVNMFEISVQGLEEGRSALQARDVDAVLVLPANYSANLSGSGAPAEVRVLIDPSTSSSLGGVAVLQQIVTQYGQEAAAASTGRPSPSSLADLGPGILTEEVVAEELSVFDFLAPGIIVFGSTSLATSVATALGREAEQGTLDRLRATSVSGLEFQAGYGIVWAGIGAAQLCILIGVSVLMGMHLTGVWYATLLAALVAGMVGVLASVGLGLTIAAFVRNESLGATIGTAVTLPIAFLIGAFFPLELAPLKVLPWQRVLEAEREILIFDGGLRGTMPIILQALVGSIVMFSVGVLLYHRRMLRPEVA